MDEAGNGLPCSHRPPEEHARHQAEDEECDSCGMVQTAMSVMHCCDE